MFGETSGFRAKGLLTKQKATIAWIDSFRPDSVFWDIGANIGSYTLYAALRPDMRVVAFEPAAVNYFILAANCELNGFGERVDCLPIGVGGGKSVERLDDLTVRACALVQLSTAKAGGLPAAGRPHWCYRWTSCSRNTGSHARTTSRSTFRR